MRALLFLSTMMLLAQASLGQSVHLIARNTADSVVLRWAPVSAENWERCQRYGYKVERVTVPLDARPRTARLTPDTLRPITETQFVARFRKDDPYAPPVAQALFGKTFAAAPNAGDPGSFMDASNERTMRWSVVMLFADYDPAIADALGLRWVDRDVRRDMRYLYRVISLDPQFGDTAVIGVDRTLGAELVPRGPKPMAKEGEGKIGLSWAKADLVEPFSGYWIERSRDGKEWTRLNKMPFLQADAPSYTPAESVFYTDTTIAGNYIPYRYRVLGITAFGETSPSAPVITAMGRDRTPPPNPVMIGVKDEHGRLVVHWDQPAGANDLKGFRVEKAPTANGPFLPLHAGSLSPATRQFTDTSTFLLGENHFHVVALDTAGNESVSLEGYGSVMDSIAPAPPDAPKGTIDTSGVVTLHWKLGKEPDLLGYRVFFANAADHVFNNLSPSPFADTLFHDTIVLKTLTRHIYYRVVAVDRNFNHSAMSPMLELTRPDIVHPVAPLFSNYHVTDTTVVLDIVPSSSVDVASYRLFRAEQGTKDNVLIASWKGNSVRTFTDTAADRDAFHRYTMQAIDSAGNASVLCVPLDVHTHGRLSRRAVDAPSANLLAGTRAIAVTWPRTSGAITRYVIYRSKDDADWFSIGFANGDATTWKDERTTGNGSYKYRVKAVYGDGAEAPLGTSSAPVILQ